MFGKYSELCSPKIHSPKTHGPQRSAGLRDRDGEGATWQGQSLALSPLYRRGNRTP